MNTNLKLVVGLVSLIAMSWAGASGAVCPTTALAAETNPETGHYFEVYQADGITWNDAKVCADSKSNSGVPGHLATITTSSEDGWVDGLRAGAGLAQGQAWVGGFQASDSAEPGGGWQWVNDEGPIPGVNTATIYANWAASEPNNSGGAESHLTLGRYGLAGGWNDEGSALGSIGGFIVEYDVPRPAACSGPSCQTINGQTLILPPGSFAAGDKINFDAFEFNDLRVASGRCGIDELILFGAAYNKPEMRIPPYLCGSPKFTVVFVDARKADNSELKVLKGGVTIENDTATVLPDNSPYVCKDTKGPIHPTPGEDPQYQDIIVYQTSDPTRMLEDSTSNRAQDPQFAGAAGEFTNSCGSSRGTGKETSYFGVGFHVDFGPGYGLNSPDFNAAGNHARFVALTRYKLTLLQQSVVAARSAGALKPAVATAMDALVRLAIFHLDHGNEVAAWLQVKLFLALVNAANYTIVSANNYNGEHLMRGKNIEFTLRVKVIPY